MINVLSTLLLGGSSYWPGWNVEGAHKGGRWLDVGVRSLRKLYRTTYFLQLTYRPGLPMACYLYWQLTTS